MGFDQYFEIVKPVGEIDWYKTNGGDLVESEEYKSLAKHFGSGTDNFAHYKSARVSIKFAQLKNNYHVDAWVREKLNEDGVLSWDDLEELWNHASHASKDILSAQILFPHPDNDHDKNFFKDIQDLAENLRWILDIYPERQRMHYDISYWSHS